MVFKLSFKSPKVNFLPSFHISVYRITINILIYLNSCLAIRKPQQLKKLIKNGKWILNNICIISVSLITNRFLQKLFL